MLKIKTTWRAVRPRAIRVWRWLRWAFLIPLIFVLFIMLTLIVGTPFWEVLDALLVPVAVVLLAWYLNRLEARFEAQRKESDAQERRLRRVDIDYELDLARLNAEHAVKLKEAASRLDARRVAELNRSYDAEVKLLDKQRKARLAQLEATLANLQRTS